MSRSYEDRHNHRRGSAPKGKIAALWRAQPEKVIGIGCAALAIFVLIVVAVVVLLGGGRAEPLGQEEPEETPWVEPVEDEQYDATSGVIDTEVFSGTVLPVTEDAGWDYVAETLFLGDSNTYRYMMYGHEEIDPETGKKMDVAFTSTANNIGVVSMGAGAITTLKCEEFKGDSKSYTMPEAVAKLKPRRIVIGFGTNNLSGTGTDASKFIETYQKGIAAIVEAWPYADIIVNSIPPLDKQRENTKLSQIQIDAYNEAIVEMCEEQGWKYLNSAEVLKDAQTGWAKKDYTLGDGVHLSKEAVTTLFEYIRTHAYIAPDRRPQPLGKIPEPSGVIPNLINSDPIAVRGQKYPIEVVVEGEGKAFASVSSAKAGVKVTLTAKPEEGWIFSYWTCSVGSISGNTLTMPATCDANGVLVVAYFEREICEEHEWGEKPVVDKAPTYTKKGEGHYVCQVCGSYSETVEIPKKKCNHEDYETEIGEPEEKDGYLITEIYCKNCGGVVETVKQPIETQEPTPPSAPPPEPAPEESQQPEPIDPPEPPPEQPVSEQPS